jgi:hypothetical protein
MSCSFSATAAAVLTISVLVSPLAAHAMARDLDKPSIGIPSAGGTRDLVVERMQHVLTAHAKEFIGGHALNALSVLHFGGGTKTINALLSELSMIEGATLHVRLSKNVCVTQLLVGARGACSCALEHNAWTNARHISLTIYLDDESIDADALLLPAVRGG